MTEPLKILMLEDSTADAEIIQRLLKKEKLHCEFRVVMHKQDFLRVLDQFHPDILLADNSLPQFNAKEALEITRQHSPDMPFIMVTGTVSDEFAADIIKSGADDYIMKDRLTRLPAAIDAALKQRRIEKEKKEALEKLIQSEEKYRTIFYQSPLPKWIYDYKSLRFLEVNEAAIRHYGYSREEFLSMTIRDIRPKKDVKLLLDDLSTIQSGSERRRGNWRHLKKNGEMITVETTAHSIDYFNGKVRLVVANDITDKIKAEQQVAAERNLLRALIDNLPDYIYVKDRASRYIINNRAFVELVGVASEEKITGKKVTDFFSKELGRVNEAEDRRVLKLGEKIIDRDEPVTRKGGEKLWLLTTKVPLIDNNENVIGILGISKDITERKKAENEISGKNEQLRELSEHLQNIREEERTSMAREIHDQLGQQITVMKMDVSWLSKKLEGADENVKEKLEELQNALNETVKMVRKIAFDLRPSLLDDLGLEAAIEWQLDEFQKRSGIKTALQKIETEPPLPGAIKTGLFRIVQESLTNVARYAQAKKVTVSLQKQNNQLVLTIKDDGVGFDKEKIAARKTFGILGMKERTLIMKGTYEINSSPGDGTTVIVRVPFEQ